MTPRTRERAACWPLGAAADAEVNRRRGQNYPTTLRRWSGKVPAVDRWLDRGRRQGCCSCGDIALMAVLKSLDGDVGFNLVLDVDHMGRKYFGECSSVMSGCSTASWSAGSN